MFFSLLVEAQESQTAYNFLRLPQSAHTAALGGDIITVVEDDLSMLFANPALLSSVSDKTIQLGVMSYMEGSLMAGAAFRTSQQQQVARNYN